MYHLAAQREIIVGFDRHLLFTIYDLLFTIIDRTTDRGGKKGGL
jgi:hypothetical protein